MTPTSITADAAIEASIDWQAMPADLRPAVQAALQSRDQRIATLEAELAMLKAQLDWFRRQVFGSKSERHVADLAQQLPLGGLQAPVPEEPDTDEPASVVVKRRKPRSDFSADGMERSFFDAQRVEVVPIEVPNEAVAGLSPEQYEVVGVKTSHRLAQRPGSYVVLEYRRSVIKRHDSGTLHCPPAPQGVFEGSRADVSFAVGLLVDKFCWHLPLYRQHQRLLAAGFKLSRQWLTQLVHQAGRLLEPIYRAQLKSIRASRVKTSDETPIKAGHAGPGKMRSAYYWPLYGGQDEVCFEYRESRCHKHAEEVLGPALPGMVLLSDGYGAYKSWAKKTGAVHAECWVHYPERCFIRRSVCPGQVLCGGPRTWSPHKNGESEGLQEGEKVRLGPPRLGTGGLDPCLLPEGLHRIALHLQVGRDVATCRRHACVSQVVPDHSDIGSGLQQGHGATVPQHVGRDALVP